MELDFVPVRLDGLSLIAVSVMITMEVKIALTVVV